MQNNKLYSVFIHLLQGSLWQKLRNETDTKARHNRKWKKFIAKGKTEVRKKLYRHTYILLPLSSRISKSIYFNQYEINEIHFIERFLKKGDVFIDIGANFGLYTILAASKAGTTGKVIAFEPGTLNFNKLKKNVLYNSQFKNIDIYNLGLSNQNSELDLKLGGQGYDAWSSYGQPSMGEEITTEKTIVRTLDDFLSEKSYNRKIDLMKIDVEGWEKKVLLGAKNTLNKDDAPVLLIEFNDKNTKPNGYQANKIYDLLLDHGYKIYEYRKKKHAGLIPAPRKEHYSYCNLLAVKNLNALNNKLSKKH
jgi:FkbM family methyltransferase